MAAGLRLGNQERRKAGNLKRTGYRWGMKLGARAMAVTAEARAGMDILGGGSLGEGLSSDLDWSRRGATVSAKVLS